MTPWGVFASGASGSARSEQFRNRNRVGEQISGSFLGWEGPGLGWVDFQGTVLLASMASQPAIGARLFFLVKQLSPEIVLQELIPRKDPGTYALLQHFRKVQSRLETALTASRPSLSPRGADVAFRLAAFRNLLEQDSELRIEFHRLQEALQPINTELAARGAGRYFALPWLADRVRSAGLLLNTTAATSGQSMQVRFAGIHPDLGRMEIHCAMQKQRPGWSLYLEQGAAMSSVSGWLEDHFPQVAINIMPFLGLRPLPEGVHSDLLPRLLISADPKRFRLHLRV